MANYFKKVMLSTPLHLANGAKIPWTACVGNVGVLETEDTELTSQLQAAIKRKIGGVSAIEQDEYEGIKKNPANKSQKPKWQPGVMPSQISPFQPSAPSSTSSAAASETPPPIQEAHKPVKASKPKVRSGVFKRSDETPDEP